MKINQPFPVFLESVMMGERGGGVMVRHQSVCEETKYELPSPTGTSPGGFVVRLFPPQSRDRCSKAESDKPIYPPQYDPSQISRQLLTTRVKRCC